MFSSASRPHLRVELCSQTSRQLQHDPRSRAADALSVQPLITHTVRRHDIDIAPIAAKGNLVRFDGADIVALLPSGCNSNICASPAAYNRKLQQRRTPRS